PRSCRESPKCFATAPRWSSRLPDFLANPDAAINAAAARRLDKLALGRRRAGNERAMAWQQIHRRERRHIEPAGVGQGLLALIPRAARSSAVAGGENCGRLRRRSGVESRRVRMAAQLADFAGW